MSESFAPTNRNRAINKPANVLKATESQAASIRKLLRRTKRSLDKRAWGDLDDAVRLAAMIEALASQAAHLPAADATSSAELLEIMVEQLSKKVSCILAS